jgi:hypothetical protein
MEFIIAHKSDLVMIFLSILGVFSMIAKITPTEADNKILDKIYAVVHMIGLTK